jgi:uncharacterized membrane protein (DUF106 family)
MQNFPFPTTYIIVFGLFFIVLLIICVPFGIFLRNREDARISAKTISNLQPELRRLRQEIKEQTRDIQALKARLNRLERETRTD